MASIFNVSKQEKAQVEIIPLIHSINCQLSVSEHAQHRRHGAGSPKWNSAIVNVLFLLSKDLFMFIIASV